MMSHYLIFRTIVSSINLLAAPVNLLYNKDSNESSHVFLTQCHDSLYSCRLKLELPFDCLSGKCWNAKLFFEQWASVIESCKFPQLLATKRWRLIDRKFQLKQWLPLTNCSYLIHIARMWRKAKNSIIGPLWVKSKKETRAEWNE